MYVTLDADAPSADDPAEFSAADDELSLPDPQALTGLANRLGSAVASREFRFGGTRAGVTASIGNARYPTNACDSASLVAAADEAMYAAKAGGRNRWARSARPVGESARMPLPDSEEPHSKED